MKPPVTITLSYRDQTWTKKFVPIDPGDGDDFLSDLQTVALKLMKKIEKETYVPDQERS